MSMRSQKAILEEPVMPLFLIVSNEVTIPRQSRGLYLCEPLKAAKRGR